MDENHGNCLLLDSTPNRNNDSVHDLFLKRRERQSSSASQEKRYSTLQRSYRQDMLLKRWQIYRQDIADWFSRLFNIDVNQDTLLDDIRNGALLCRLAHLVWQNRTAWKRTTAQPRHTISSPRFKDNVSGDSFQARDNIASFLAWARAVGTPPACLFETNDIIMMRNQNNILNCLMEIARGAPYLSALPQLIEFEREIDGEVLSNERNLPKDEDIKTLIDSITASNLEVEICDSHEVFHYSHSDNVTTMRCAEELSNTEKPSWQNSHQTELETDNKLQRKPDLEAKTSASLSSVFPVESSKQIHLKPLGKGQYQLGKQILHCRIFRNHVVVRVGGGWDSLENYLETHRMQPQGSTGLVQREQPIDLPSRPSQETSRTPSLNCAATSATATIVQNKVHTTLSPKADGAALSIAIDYRSENITDFSSHSPSVTRDGKMPTSNESQSPMRTTPPSKGQDVKPARSSIMGLIKKQSLQSTATPISQKSSGPHLLPRRKGTCHEGNISSPRLDGPDRIQPKQRRDVRVRDLLKAPHTRICSPSSAVDKEEQQFHLLEFHPRQDRSAESKETQLRDHSHDTLYLREIEKDHGKERDEKLQQMCGNDIHIAKLQHQKLEASPKEVKHPSNSTFQHASQQPPAEKVDPPKPLTSSVSVLCKERSRETPTPSSLRTSPLSSSLNTRERTVSRKTPNYKANSTQASSPATRKSRPGSARRKQKDDSYSCVTETKPPNRRTATSTAHRDTSTQPPVLSVTKASILQQTSPSSSLSPLSVGKGDKSKTNLISSSKHSAKATSPSVCRPRGNVTSNLRMQHQRMSPKQPHTQSSNSQNNHSQATHHALKTSRSPCQCAHSPNTSHLRPKSKELSHPSFGTTCNTNRLKRSDLDNKRNVRQKSNFESGTGRHNTSRRHIRCNNTNVGICNTPNPSIKESPNSKIPQPANIIATPRKCNIPTSLSTFTPSSSGCEHRSAKIQKEKLVATGRSSTDKSETEHGMNDCIASRNSSNLVNTLSPARPLGKDASATINDCLFKQTVANTSTCSVPDQPLASIISRKTETTEIGFSLNRIGSRSFRSSHKVRNESTQSDNAAKLNRANSLRSRSSVRRLSSLSSDAPLSWV